MKTDLVSTMAEVDKWLEKYKATLAGSEDEKFVRR
jgi:hypothetical protein